MMTTPIFDFIKKYQSGNNARLHMPGHKGIGPLGCEGLDITEISGADSLHEASGIIAESEKNASLLGVQLPERSTFAVNKNEEMTF